MTIMNINARPCLPGRVVAGVAVLHHLGHACVHHLGHELGLQGQELGVQIPDLHGGGLPTTGALRKPIARN